MRRLLKRPEEFGCIRLRKEDRRQRRSSIREAIRFAIALDSSSEAFPRCRSSRSMRSRAAVLTAAVTLSPVSFASRRAS
jgi:hypothetical protein